MLKKIKGKWLKVLLVLSLLAMCASVNIANAGYFDSAAYYTQISQLYSADADRYLVYYLLYGDSSYLSTSSTNAYYAYYYASYANTYTGYAYDSGYSYAAYPYGYYADYYAYYTYIYKYYAYLYSGSFANAASCALYSYYGIQYGAYTAYYAGAASILALN